MMEEEEDNDDDDGKDEDTDEIEAMAWMPHGAAAAASVSSMRARPTRRCAVDSASRAYRPAATVCCDSCGGGSAEDEGEGEEAVAPDD
jgi:hypothetical protein